MNDNDEVEDVKEQSLNKNEIIKLEIENLN